MRWMGHVSSSSGTVIEAGGGLSRDWLDGHARAWTD